jgi:hypothetical protein
VKSRDFWTSKPRKRHDGRQGEGCRSSKENKKNVGSRWRSEVQRRLGCGGEETKDGTFRMTNDLHTRKKVATEKARLSLDFATQTRCDLSGASCCTQNLCSNVSTNSAHSKWVLSDPTTRPLKAPPSLIKRRERVSPSALRTYQMAHTAARVSRPDF